MANLKHSALEVNEENDAGVTVTLYFDAKPTEAEVKAACQDTDVDTDDRFFSWGVYPNALSKKSKWVRVQAFG